MATEYNITHDQGTDLNLLLTIADQNNVPLSLDGYQFKGQARTGFGVKTVAFSFDFEVLNQITNKGKMYVKILPSSTSALSITTRTTYVYDIEMTNDNGQKVRLFEGKITLRPEVTR